MKKTKLFEEFKNIIKSVIRNNYHWKKLSKNDNEFAEKCIKDLKMFYGEKMFAYNHKKGFGVVIPIPNANNYWTDEMFEIYKALRDFYGERVFIDWSQTNNPELKKFTEQDNNILIVLFKEDMEAKNDNRQNSKLL